MTPGGVYILSSNSSLTRSEFKTWPIFGAEGGNIVSIFWRGDIEGFLNAKFKYDFD